MKNLQPIISLFCSLAFSITVFTASGQFAMKPAPDRGADEGEGPFDRLIIRGATVIDGSGAPAYGPIDIVIEENKIVEVRNVGTPKVPINEDDRPKNATKEIDASGSYVLPGFVNLHVHVDGGPKAPEAEYVYKLYLAHGITTIRGVPAGNVNWVQSEKKRSAQNKIVAPRIFAFQVMGAGGRLEGWPDTYTRKSPGMDQVCGFKGS